MLQPTQLKVLLSPRNEENPYLPHLRDALQSRGVTVDWFESEATSSHTVNALLAPWELWKRRRQGFEVLHLHWVYKFAWPSVAAIPGLKRLPRLWFGVFLRLARTMGFTVVYTWHDLVPVVGVFDDDAAARRAMRHHLDGVITITDAAKRDVSRRFGVPLEQIDVIPEGPPEIGRRLDRGVARTQLGFGTDAVAVGAFGHIAPYKGLDLLLEAAERLGDDVDFAIRIIGHAADPAYAARMGGLVASLREVGRDVQWSDRVFSQDELETLLSATDVVALPFRSITNSATLRFSMAWGATVILPRLAAFDDIPVAAAAWYDADDEADLVRVLDEVLRTWPSGAAERRSAALEWVSRWSWDAVGDATIHAYGTARQRRRGG
jgi:glycosyltransferase involved in cell wall biosynthesis